MNIKDFELKFINDCFESPKDAALCALTSLILKDIFPDQKERFYAIDNVFRNNKKDVLEIPEILKTSLIFNTYHQRQVEDNQALKKLNDACSFLTHKGPYKFLTEQTQQPPKSNCSNCDKTDCATKQIEKWW